MEKVSTLYLVGIGLNRQPRSGEAPPDLPPTSPWVSALPQEELQPAGAPPEAAIIGEAGLHPPAPSGYGCHRLQPGPARLPVRHPDQPATRGSAGALVIVAVAYAAYLWKRKAIIDRFEQNQAKRLSADARARRGVERWMRLYYCNRDDAVFDAQGSELIPTDQMPGYLFHPEKP